MTGSILDCVEERSAFQTNFSFSRNGICAICQEKVFMSGRGDGGYVVFFCRHVYHRRCMTPDGTKDVKIFFSFLLFFVFFLTFFFLL